MSTGDEEPLVNRFVNRRGRQVRSGGDTGGSTFRVGRSLGQCSVSQVNLATRRLTLDKLLPRLAALGNDLLGVLLVLAFTREGELVLRLPVGNLVDSEPLVSGTQQAWQVSLDILNIVEFGGQRIVDIDNNDLPVSLTLVQKSHHTQNLDLLDLANVSNFFTDFTDIQWIVVTLGLGLRVGDVWVFPGLWECTIVVDVAMVRETVAHKSQFSLLGVLENGIQLVLLGDLHLGVSPSGHLNNHVQDGLLLVSIQGDVMKGGHGLAILFDENSVFQCVGSTNSTGCVSHDKRRVGAEKNAAAGNFQSSLIWESPMAVFVAIKRASGVVT